MAKDKPKPYNCRSALTLTEQILAELAYFQPDGDEPPAIPHVWKQGRNPLVVVVGDNAGGKSFFRRLVQGACSHSKVECIAISMEGRETSPGFVKACVYGTEQWDATGANSAHTILMGIKTCRERDKPHTIFWDEPDLGLSDSWAAGAGVAIREFAQDLPEHTRAVYVVSHSKALVRELLPAQPHYLHLGSVEAPVDLTGWLEQPVKPRDLSKLSEAGHQRFKRIQRILNEKKRK